ncbi:MAG: D-tyrosyl-tRNA(Tyr) deacylase [Candidatus Eisenbacteria bacterium]|nr:D-tyrosyl-tRNA(Tyr) deacylase [Candidatus Eisenbacteria bacterium]
MRAVLQRAASGRVAVDGSVIGEIGRGLVVLLGVASGDTEREAEWMAGKISQLRIFEDDDGKMNLSVLEVEGAVLLVSQFTLLASCAKGRRPSFTRAAPPEIGRVLYERVGQHLRDQGLRVETGRFGSLMRVSIENDGPVTIVLDSAEGPMGEGAEG